MYSILRYPEKGNLTSGPARKTWAGTAAAAKARLMTREEAPYILTFSSKHRIKTIDK